MATQPERERQRERERERGTGGDKQLVSPPTDDGGFRDFYHNRTNSILQQLKINFWKIVGALFRISTMTNSFKYTPRGVYRPYSLVVN
jgi:hypothetical protein